MENRGARGSVRQKTCYVVEKILTVKGVINTVVTVLPGLQFVGVLSAVVLKIF